MKFARTESASAKIASGDLATDLDPKTPHSDIFLLVIEELIERRRPEAVIIRARKIADMYVTAEASEIQFRPDSRRCVDWRPRDEDGDLECRGLGELRHLRAREKPEGSAKVGPLIRHLAGLHK